MKTCGDYGGTSVQTKKPCGKSAGWGTDHVGTGKCRRHGGKALAGPAHPNYKHGHRSRYAHRLSADQQDDYLEALAAPDPLGLQEEIALLRTMAVQAVAPGPDLYLVKRLVRDMEKRLEEMLNEEMSPEADKICRGCIQLASETYEALTGANARGTDEKSFTGHVETLRKLVDTSARVMDIRANSFTRLQSQALIGRIVELIAGNVKDPQDRKRLLTALTYLDGEIAPARQIAGKGGTS